MSRRAIGLTSLFLLALIVLITFAYLALGGRGAEESMPDALMLSTYWLLVLPGMVIQLPWYAATALFGVQACSPWLGGHAPSCEIFGGLVVWTTLALMILVVFCEYAEDIEETRR